MRLTVKQYKKIFITKTATTTSTSPPDVCKTNIHFPLRPVFGLHQLNNKSFFTSLMLHYANILLILSTFQITHSNLIHCQYKNDLGLQLYMKCMTLNVEKQEKLIGLKSILII